MSLGRHKPIALKADIRKNTKLKPYEQGVTKKFSSYLWMLAFGMASISIVFLTLTVTYLFSKTWDTANINLVIPKIFYIDTAILILGSVALQVAHKAFDEDKVDLYKMCLYLALISGFAFLAGQLGGWYVLADTGYGLTEHKSASFLYVISGIHALHIIGGIVFLLYIFFKASKGLQDPALSIVYFSDPVPKQQLRLSRYYWHFLGVLWIYLLIFFAVVR